MCVGKIYNTNLQSANNVKPINDNQTQINSLNFRFFVICLSSRLLKILWVARVERPKYEAISTNYIVA
jgi:hypothetical protein